MKRIALTAVLCVAAALTLGLTLSSGSATSSTGCVSVNGHLLDEHVSGGHSVARLIGGIQGDYEFTNGGILAANPDYPSVMFGYGTTVVHTSVGDLAWTESSTLDFDEAVGNPQAVFLATVTGGTGQWAGASGHIAFWGHFSPTTLTGAFDYRGAVCFGA